MTPADAPRPPEQPRPTPGEAGVLATSVRPVDELALQLIARGWRVGVVSGGTSLREALDAVGRALGFPSYYGRNLDALWDCLGDLDHATALVWAGWEPLAVHAPDDWAALLGVLGRRVRTPGRPAFAVVFSAPGVPDAPAS